MGYWLKPEFKSLISKKVYSLFISRSQGVLETRLLKIAFETILLSQSPLNPMFY